MLGAVAGDFVGSKVASGTAELVTDKGKSQEQQIKEGVQKELQDAKDKFNRFNEAEEIEQQLKKRQLALPAPDDSPKESEEVKNPAETETPQEAKELIEEGKDARLAQTNPEEGQGGTADTGPETNQQKIDPDTAYKMAKDAYKAYREFKGTQRVRPQDPNGAYKDETQVDNNRPKGDFYLNNPDVDTASATMRDNYHVATGRDVIPTSRKQLESDINFDMFDNVLPGYGNGPDNKLFLQQEKRQERIIEMGPLDGPGQWIGPINGLSVPSWHMQRVIPDKLIKQHQKEKDERALKAAKSAVSYGASSIGVFGADIGYPAAFSSKGLKRRAECPLEPAIRLDFDWQTLDMPTPKELQKRRMRTDTDALRYPEQLQSRPGLMGGPTLLKRRSLLQNMNLM